ncbi:SFT2-like protein [Plasmodium cynomolgi strain B]|uniref:Vesicle transport protein n=1 Tax=Plasmodium cynomolgi (strain B) TaxID=1120755 RepID=K6UW46_PLACD|nr:SFT2-like protein [Plasmodium cynomolgi strain B]GAB67844.1 SFT2-like protein [Plasmodium cynomolgi strain B]
MGGENNFDGLSFFENNEFQNINRDFLRGSMDSTANEEEKGLIQKAISLSKKGAENIQKGIKKTLEKTNLNNAPSLVSNSTTAETGSMFSNFPLFNSQSRENEPNSFFAFTTVLSYKNFPLFCLFFGISILFLILSFFTLPMIVITPRQFGFFFTLSSICFVTSLAFLKGFSSLYYHLMEKNRLPFTAAYILSLLSTLYFTVIKPLYLLALITSIVQVFALISFIVSYIPGGSGAIKMLLTTLFTYIKNLFRRGNSSDLPF